MQQDSKQITLVNEGEFDRRIDVLKILREFGLSLCESHQAINELAGTGPEYLASYLVATRPSLL